MMTRIHREMMRKGRSDSVPAEVDCDAIAWRLSNASYASQQARQLLNIVFDHQGVTENEALCALVVACLDYLEDGEDTIAEIWPLIGFRTDGEPALVRPS
jgi:hypothetical protein